MIQSSTEFTGAALLFDLDGTLIDTAADLGAAMNYALNQAGHPFVDSKEVRGLVGYGARRMLATGYALSLGRPASDRELDRDIIHFLDYYARHIVDHSRPFPGVVDMIKTFRQAGASIAICTNKREALAVQLIRELGLSKVIDTIVGADTASAAKPDPAPVLLCLKRLNAKRGIFIGDSDTDIQAAAACGLPCLAAKFGYGPTDNIADAHASFSDYNECELLIRAILAP